MYQLRLLLPVFFILSGCVTGPSKYVAPTSGPLANITFINELPNENGNDVFLYENSSNCTGGGILNVPTGKQVSTKIAAGNDFALGFTHTEFVPGASTECRVIISFVPKVNTSYIAAFVYSRDKSSYVKGLGMPRFASGGSCDAQVSKIERDDQGKIIRVVPIEIHKRQADGGNRCRPLEQS